MDDQPANAKPLLRSRLRKGDTARVTIDGLSYGGRGVGRDDGYVVFVPYTAPGDLVAAHLTKAKKSHGEADLIEVLHPAAERIEPPCPLFGTCGGCAWQHLPVDLQEHWKARIVRDSLRHVPGLDIDAVAFDPIVESPDAYHYRNKMEFTFGRAWSREEGTHGPLKLGFHTPGNWRDVLDVPRCWLHPEPLNAVLEAARAECQRQGTTAWDPVQHAGTLRHLVLRWSVYEQRALVAVLTSDREKFDFESFHKAVTDACPDVKGVLWGVNTAHSDVARAEEIVGTWGEETLEERIEDLSFQISLSSFFQTNTRGAVELYRVARDYLSLTGKERLLDAYCGTGTIGLFCSHQCAQVYGIEVVREAIWDARANAVRNGRDNTTFLAGDMALTLPTLLGAMDGTLNRVVVDPPRGGMEKKALQQLAALRVPVFVYVSCNPTTMARDMETLIAEGYRLERVCPVDMFPQTYHVECVARLVRDHG